MLLSCDTVNTYVEQSREICILSTVLKLNHRNIWPPLPRLNLDKIANHKTAFKLVPINIIGNINESHGQKTKTMVNELYRDFQCRSIGKGSLPNGISMICH